MANLIDYLDWRGDLPLECAPFNPVDGLILAWLASMPLPDPLPATIGAAAEWMIADGLEGDALIFAQKLAENPRFRDMELRRFERRFSEPEELQFAAVTVLTGDGKAFVAYRGTDSTLVGWKEDLNLSFSDEVPAQREAVRYLAETAAAVPMPLRVGGHSKGGNLAVYAAAKSAPDVQSRIETIYNFDGPGQTAATLASDGYLAVEPRVETFLPGSSIVGILLERSPRYHVVRAEAVGPMQHKPESWQVTRGGFELLDSLSWPSLYADRTIRDWLDSMSMDDRERFVEAIYDVVGATQARTIQEVGEDWERSGWRMLEAFAGLDLRTRAMLFLSLGKLLRAAVRNLDG